MKDDPAIQVVRDVRHKISESVGHDPRKLVEYYQKRQKQHPEYVARKTEDTRCPQDEDAA